MPHRRVCVMLITVVLAMLLGWAASTADERAWILWSRTSIPSRQGYQWEIIRGYEHYDACEADRWKNIIEDLDRQRYMAGKIGGMAFLDDDVVVLGREGELTTSTYRCLPDAIDLRGPRK